MLGNDGAIIGRASAVRSANPQPRREAAGRGPGPRWTVLWQRMPRNLLRYFRLQNHKFAVHDDVMRPGLHVGRYAAVERLTSQNWKAANSSNAEVLC